MGDLMEEGIIKKDMKPKFIEDLGMRFATESSKKKYRYGLFECAYCGGEWETMVSSVKMGTTKSCGCQKVNTLGITHGFSYHKFYKTWKHMVDRCNNPKNKAYKDYGGRGITVCEEWLDITNFIVWAERTHPNISGVSLDRIDNDGAYSPKNCRWADRTTQNINQRIKKNNTSGFVGIYWNNKNNNWRTCIHLNNVRFNIGTFLTIEEAVLARDNYIVENKLPHKLSTEYMKEEQINE